MAHILIMPRQGNTVESCIITGWKVKQGDVVTAETAVCEVETDKAAFEIPAGASGTVLVILAEAGADVPVLAPIAVIGAPGDDWPAALANIDYEKMEASHGDAKTQRDTPVSESSSANLRAFAPRTEGSMREENSEVAISPRARNLAAKEALPLPVTGSGPGGRIIERDMAAALQGRPPLSAAAKAVGPGTVPALGSGIGGRVTTGDIASIATGTVTPLKPSSPVPEFTETPIKGIRKIIADRMFRSLAESAQLTLNASAPAAKLQELRSRIKAENAFSEEYGLSKITINDLILFAVARTLPRFPFMNANKINDTIRTFNRVHLAVAVDTPRGLMVPVIRNADLLSLAQISSEAKRLAVDCQKGSANPDELSGSTFTVTNLGSFGITSFTPVLNAPDVAILGVCGIEMKPVAVSGAEANVCGCDCDCGVCFVPHIGFSLTIDHQAVDGAPAARFLRELCESVARIDLLLAAG
ncbi:MAG: 2-oxo acid dehydrogenase subunit E2 [Treponema sp.]|jgi:pyruvate dehydrogenase E2 component (dihydrolipoamide acetyltransferase)|nr:2-oxo acid dehydrogenase subunit E2 [Treponema sp.]